MRIRQEQDLSRKRPRINSPDSDGELGTFTYFQESAGSAVTVVTIFSGKFSMAAGGAGKEAATSLADRFRAAIGKKGLSLVIFVPRGE